MPTTVADPHAATAVDRLTDRALALELDLAELLDTGRTADAGPIRAELVVTRAALDLAVDDLVDGIVAGWLARARHMR